jgi:hypothetical protein
VRAARRATANELMREKLADCHAIRLTQVRRLAVRISVNSSTWPRARQRRPGGAAMLPRAHTVVEPALSVPPHPALRPAASPAPGPVEWARRRMCTPGPDVAQLRVDDRRREEMERLQLLAAGAAQLQWLHPPAGMASRIMVVSGLYHSRVDLEPGTSRFCV